MFRFLFRLGAVLLLGVLGLAQVPDKPLVPAKEVVELRERCAGILKEARVPGMGIVLANREGVLWADGIGLADVAAKRPATAATVFRIGSITKTFAGLAALKLVEEGRLRLDAPVRSLVPEVVFTNRWEASDPVRVVHLLEHTTGWDDIHDQEYLRADPRPPTLAEALALAPATRTCRWRPGTRFAYCNAGPAVTAAIVERLTGKRFEAYVEETFFQPLGMTTADFFDSPRTRTLLTNLYRNDGRTPIPYGNIWYRPSGALNASPMDMGAYLSFFLRRGEGRGGRILSEASIERMETPASSWTAQGGIKAGYGIHSYAMGDDRGFVWHGHDGAVEGGVAFFAYLPGEGVGCFVALNAGNLGAMHRIMKEVQSYLTQGFAAPVPPPARPVPPSVARAFGGWYEPISPRSERMAFLQRVLLLSHASFRQDSLRIKPLLGPAHVYVAVDGTRFRSDKGCIPQLVLLDTPEGRVVADAGMMFGRIGAFRAWATVLIAALFLFALVTVPLFALVWGVRWAFRRMRGVPGLQVRVLPLLAWLCLAGVVVDFGLSADQFMERFGQRTLWSMGVTVGTVAFALLSLGSLVAALQAPRRGMNRWAYGHSLLVAAVFTFVTAYLVWNGIIGFRSWI